VLGNWHEVVWTWGPGSLLVSGNDAGNKHLKWGRSEAYRGSKVSTFWQYV
jgi:hypothetical protein